MQLSVIIPCKDGADTLGHQLAALVHQHVDFEWEVLVVDNGSTDDSVGMAQRFADLLPHLRIIDGAETPGPGYARNVGAKVAKGDWLVFVDADDAVGGGWLKAVARALETSPVVASRFEALWLNSGLPNRPFGQRDGLETLWYPPYLPHAGGSGLAVWRRAHETVGGFDEKLAFLEDADYCLRLQLAGFPLHFASDALLHVRCKDNGGGLFRQARTWARANTGLYRKYGLGGPGAGARWKQFASDLLQVASMVGRLRSRRGRSALVWQTGWHVGLLEGALKNRVAPVGAPPAW